MRVLSIQSAVEMGDTVSTQGKGYAQIRFSDNSLLTLQPDTVVALNSYAYVAATPAQDELLFTLKQGGIRTDVGQLGLRSPDRVTLVTPAARIGLQSANAVVRYLLDPKAVVGFSQASRHLALIGAEFEASAVQSDSSYGAFAAIVAARYSYRLASGVAWLQSWVTSGISPVAAIVPGSLAPGLYIGVLNGTINVSNSSGATMLATGQFGYTPSFAQPPVIVPKSPGLAFTAPPSFSSALGNASPTSTAAVDCVVR